MKTILIAMTLVCSPIGEWQTEIKPSGDVWENWSDRLILRFRPQEWDAPQLEPVIDLSRPAIEA
jgi:hypothetical protein